MRPQKISEKIATKQKKLYAIILGCLVLCGGATVLILHRMDSKSPPQVPKPRRFDTISKEVKAEDIRLSTLENFNDVLSDRMQSLEKSVLDLREEKSLIEGEKESLLSQTENLREKVRALEVDLLSDYSFA